MKTLNSKLPNDILNEFVLTIEEMIYVRGGEGDPVLLPTVPTTKI
jgi:hypothetical protein